MRILIFLFAILLSLSFSITKDDNKIVDCQIVEATDKFFAITCDSEAKIIMEFDKSSWPKEWKDSEKVGDIVKVKLDNDIMFPIKSCAARAKEMEEKYNKRGSGQLRKPFQLPLDKDCMGK